ncbi:MAG: major outer membrane protein, partial [Campylobacterales bacterium]
MLKRVSLAALIGIGLGSFASATPLTEAIKNVDLNGMLRVRFYYKNVKNENGEWYSYNRWRTNAILIFKVHADENLDFVWRTSVQSNNYSKSSSDVVGKTSNGDNGLLSNLLFFDYHANGAKVMVGKIPLATPITSIDPATPTHSAGILGEYKFNDNFAVAAAWADKTLNANPNDSDYVGTVVDNDIYTAALLYNTKLSNGGKVDAQLWYFYIDNLLDYDVVLRLGYEQPITNGKIKVSLDYAVGKNKKVGESNDLDNATPDSLKSLTNPDDAHTYAHLDISGKYNNFFGSIGYVGTNKNAGIVELSEDSPIANALPVEQRFAVANELDISGYYLKLGMDVNDKLSVEAAYAYIDQGEDYGNNDSNEWKIGATYKYNKKVSFNVYYDVLDYDDAATAGTDQQEGR